MNCMNRKPCKEGLLKEFVCSLFAKSFEMLIGLLKLLNCCPLKKVWGYITRIINPAINYVYPKLKQN